MLPLVRIKCPFCFEKQEVLVEPDDGEVQNLIIDCEVCCHPMDIHVVWNDEKKIYQAQSDKSSGF
jgi:hypothetical protein